MIYKVGNGETVYDQGGCKGTKLYEEAGNEYVHLSIEPRGGIPEHSIPLAVSFCVLKGSGVCSISGEELAVGQGEMVECPPNEPRGWSNSSDGILEVLVIKRAAC